MKGLVHRRSTVVAAALLIAVPALLRAAPPASRSGASGLPTPPPPPPVRPVTDTDFGTAVADRYRYFENLNDPVVKAYFKDQNAYTRAVLARLDPARERLFRRITQLDATGTSVSSVQLDGSRYFYLRRAPGDNNEKLCVRDAAGGQERVLVDPDALATKPGQHFTINYFTPSLDGRYVAFGISEGGSEDSVIHVIETATGKQLPDAIDRAKFVGVTGWRPDGTSFYYMRLPKLAAGQSANEAEQRAVNYLHVLGSDPDKDVPVLGFGINPKIVLDPNDFSVVAVSPVSSYAIGLIVHGVRNEVTVYAAPLASITGPQTPWKKLLDVDDDVTAFDWRGDTIYLQSHKDAPHYKVLEMSLAQPDVANAKTIVAPSTNVIQQISVAKDALYVRGIDGGIGTVGRVPFAADGAAGSPVPVGLPYQGAVQLLATDPRDDGATFGLTSWTRTLLYYAYLPGGTLTDTRLKAPAPVDAAPYTSVEVKAPSADGTEVPLSIVYRKGIRLDNCTGTRRYPEALRRPPRRHAADPLLFDDADRVARAQRRVRRLPRPRRWRVRRGLAPRGHDRDEAAHDRRLRRLCALSDRPSLYVGGAPRGRGNERRRYPHRRSDHAASRVVRCRARRRWFERRATAGVFAERTAQHSRVRHGQGRDRIPRAARDGRVSARAPRGRLSCGHADYRDQRPARAALGTPAKFAAAPAGRDLQPPARAAARRL